MGRPVRNKSQWDSSYLLQSNHGTLSLLRWCPSDRLVQRSPVHIPTDSAASPGPHQGPPRGSQREVGSHWSWACWSTIHCFFQFGQIWQGIRGGFPTQASAPSGYLLGGSWEKLSKQREFLRQLHAPSALVRDILHNNCLMPKWPDFCHWCDEQYVDHLQPNPRQAVEHLADTPLEHVMILVHVSALSSSTYGIDGVQGGVHPLVSAWIIGHKVWRPPVKLRMHPWELPGCSGRFYRDALWAFMSGGHAIHDV